MVLISVGALLTSLLVLWLIGERGHPLLRSTWAGLKAGGLRNLLNLKALRMYVYGRWTKQYNQVLVSRVFPRLDSRGRQRWSDRYHGKVLTPEHARAVVTLEQDIPLQELEQIIPYPVARSLVLKGPPEVAAYECACRKWRDNPCQPTQVCMVIGQPFVDFVLEHHPRGSRRLTQAEALDLLEAEHKRGHMHSAWFKDALLDRFYAICNCCKCCCGGIQAMVKYGIPMVASSGYVACVDETRCRACSTCEEACAFGAIRVDEAAAVLDWEKCMGCGVCVGQCPAGAVSLVRDERKGEPLDVRLLAQQGAARSSRSLPEGSPGEHRS